MEAQEPVAADPGLTCRVCGEGGLVPLWEADGCGWHRCLACGSDTSGVDPAALDALYRSADYCGLPPGCPDRAAAVAQYATNVDLMLRHARDFAGHRDFLDVGCNEGAGLTAFQDAGWRVHGFDVNPHARTGDHVTVAPCLSPALFPRRYDAVLCREVVEHVGPWRALVADLARVTKPGGLCQVQTPRPQAAPLWPAYQRPHLQLFSVHALECELRRAGLEPIDRLVWPLGCCFVCRRPG